jgi:hypothetical protein
MDQVRGMNVTFESLIRVRQAADAVLRGEKTEIDEEVKEIVREWLKDGEDKENE